MSTYLVCSSKSYQAIDDENVVKPYAIVSGKKLPITTQTSTRITYTRRETVSRGSSMSVVSSYSAAPINIYTRANSTTSRMGLNNQLSALSSMYTRISGSKVSGVTEQDSVTNCQSLSSTFSTSQVTLGSGVSSQITKNTSRLTNTASKIEYADESVSGISRLYIWTSTSKYTSNNQTSSFTNQGRMTRTAWANNSTALVGYFDYTKYIYKSSTALTKEGHVSSREYTDREYIITNTGSNIYATNDSKTYKIINQSTSAIEKGASICSNAGLIRLIETHLYTRRTTLDNINYTFCFSDDVSPIRYTRTSYY